MKVLSVTNSRVLMAEQLKHIYVHTGRRVRCIFVRPPADAVVFNSNKHVKCLSFSSESGLIQVSVSGQIY